jgi:L-methionine (R)-S-oxide reductase
MEDQLKVFSALLREVGEIVAGPLEQNQKLQAICELLRDCVAHYDWVGFYLVEPSTTDLVLGSYAGQPTEHVRIPVGRGICGQAAQRKQIFVVQDVSQESNYLSCSPKVRSEIVVPIFRDGKVVGQLDIDSHALAAFSQGDWAFLEEICKAVGSLL